MHLVSPELETYIEQHTTEENDLLYQINRETNLHVMMPQMLSGRVQGQALRMFSMMIRPSRILELGTFTGYSAICLAQGLVEGGRLITIDINEELKYRTQQYFIKAGLGNIIEMHTGNAVEIIPSLNEVFDLVFIDADKQNYSLYLELVINKVRHGGFIIADNVLWSGKVIQHNPDKDTKAIQDFNDKVKNDSRLDCVIFSVRDGMMVMRKKG